MVPPEGVDDLASLWFPQTGIVWAQPPAGDHADLRFRFDPSSALSLADQNRGMRAMLETLDRTVESPVTRAAILADLAYLAILRDDRAELARLRPALAGPMAETVDGVLAHTRVARDPCP